MIPTQQDRQVVSQGLQGSRAFGISRRNETFIKMILRDKIYKDKVLAVLREYSTNAWDAHRMASQADVPIEVTLPTLLDPVLVIRDFGPGLSPDDMVVFTEYGESTKRDTNDATGMLGLGCKSGFAYGDQFTVTSWHGGMKRVYNATLTDDDDDFSLMGEVPCGDETGVEIKIPVRPEDVWQFENRAHGLFPYFEPLPQINIDLMPIPGTRRTHGFIEEKGLYDRRDGGRGARWVAVMGCIPYEINIGQMVRELEHEGLWETLQNMSGGLFFKIGDVSFTVSREELEYTEQTKTALVTKFKALIEEFTEEVLAALDSATMKPWDKRLKANFMRGSLRLPIPAKYAHWGREKVHFSKEVPAPKGSKDEQGNLLKTITVKPVRFHLACRDHSDTKVTSAIRVSVTTKVYVQDDTRSLSGFRDLGSDHVVVCPSKGHKLDAARAEFDQWVADLDIGGITVENLSCLDWTPTRRNGKMPNRKHNVRSFRLRERVHSGGRTLSENWEIVRREPTDEDVFVVISYFKVDDGTSFYDRVRTDRHLAKTFGLPFPEVYGYKSTEKKPVTAADCQGTEYHEWRKDYFRKCLNSTLFAQVAAYHWATVLNNYYPCWYDGNKRRSGTLDGLLLKCRETLGDKHPITRLVSQHRQGLKDLAKVPRARREALGDLVKAIKSRRRPSASIALEQVTAMYPLLEGTDTALNELVGRKGDMWIDYIKMADKVAGRAF